MTEINSIGAGNYNYTYRQQPVLSTQQNAYLKQNCKYDSFESSEKRTGTVGKTIVALFILAGTALWLTKGKGWNKIKNLLGLGKKQVKQETEAIEEMVNRNTKQSNTIQNIEPANTDNNTRNLVERAKADTPTPAQQAAYDKEVAYQAPTAKEAKGIQQSNKTAKQSTANAHRVENLIPPEQAEALKKAASTKTTIKNSGTYKTKNGYSITYDNGNITEIVTPDGRIITKSKTIAKYIKQIDMDNLEVAKNI